MRHLRFDNTETRGDRVKTDKLAAIRDMYEIIVDKFRTSYTPGVHVTIDERISPFKGNVSFKVSDKNN